MIMHASSCTATAVAIFRWVYLLPIIMSGRIKIRPPRWGTTLLLMAISFVAGWAAHALNESMVSRAVDFDEARRVTAPLASTIIPKIPNSK